MVFSLGFLLRFTSACVIIYIYICVCVCVDWGWLGVCVVSVWCLFGVGLKLLYIV